MPGTAGHIINRRAVEFAITRTVRDTAHLLDAVQGATSADLFHLPLPSRPFATELEVRPRPLRIGVMTAVPGGIDLHPECKEAIDRTVAILSDLGHNVEETWPNALTQERKDLYAPISSALFRLDFAHIERMLGRPLREDDVEPYHWEVADLGNACGSAIDLLLAQEDDHAWCAEVLGWWQQGYDLLLTPTTAFPPWPNAELTLAMDTATIGKRSRCLTALTRPFNLTGQPAITLPLHWTKEGLPLGVQFVADMGREDLLIQLAAQLEEAMPWRDRFPLMLSEEK